MRRTSCRLALALAVAASTYACSGKKDEPASAPASATAAVTPGSAEAAAPAFVLPDGPVAKVNGVEISKTEFEQKYAKMTKAFTTRKKDIPENLAKRYTESILKQLIEKELLKQKIEKEQIKIEDVELTAAFDDYKKMFRTDENFDRYLKSSEVDVEQIKDNIRHNASVDKLLEKGGSLVVPVEESTAYFVENKKRYEVQEQIHASHILVKLDAKADKAADAAALKKANELYKDVMKKGSDFAAIAQKSSDGPTANRGGDLSFFPRGRMVKEFEDIAFKMKAGEVSKPVKTQFGYHIIKLVEHKDGRDRPFEEVKEAIDKLLKNKKQRKAKLDLLVTLRAEAKFEGFIPEAESAAATIGKEEEKPPTPTINPIMPMSGGMPGLALPGAGGLNAPALKLPLNLMPGSAPGSAAEADPHAGHGHK